MDPWSQFWLQGYPTTFGAYFEKGYDGAIKEWFLGRLKTVSGEANVLEMACGNGSLISMLMEAGVKGHYVGVDQAKVDIPAPIRDRLGAQTELSAMLRGGVSAECVPLENNVFDVICSIYGIEYSDMSKSIREVSRLLKAGGLFLSVMHHNNSIVASMSERAIREYKLDEVRDFLAQLTLIGKEATKVDDLKLLSTNPKAEKARKKINSYATKYLSETTLNTANASMFEFVTHGLQFFKILNLGHTAHQKFITNLYEETLASRERHRQMCSVAINQTQMETMVSLLNSAGLRDVQVSVLEDDTSIVGWALCAKKQ